MSNTITNVFALGSAYAGATLRAQLYADDNVASGAEINIGFYERDGTGGIFAFTLTTADGFVGYCDVYEDGASGEVLGCIAINPQEVENADVKTSTRGTGTSTLTTGDIDARLTAYDGATQADLNAAVAPLATQVSVDALPTAGDIDTQLSGTHGGGSWEDTGAGASAADVWSYVTRTLTALGSPAGIVYTYTVTDSVTTDPIPDVSVWFATDSAISHIVWYGSTDAFGIARDANGNKPRLDAGTYYILCRKTGYVFNIDQETVTA